ncbi:MAG: hypothetical protein ACJ73U_30645, partial [Actinophytocola sp.]
RAANSAVPLPRFADLWQAFTHLVDINAGPGGVPPSLVLLDAVAAEVRGDVGGAMRAWVEQKVRHQGAENALEERRRDMSPSTGAPGLHLLLALEHDGISGDRYVLSSWRQTMPGVWPPAKVGIREVDEDYLERAFDEEVVAAERAWADQLAPVTLEVILPRELIHLPVHRWNKEHESGQPQPLCVEYIIRVRSLERMRSEHWHRVWRKRWRSLNDDPSPMRIYFGGAEGVTERVDVALHASDSVAMVLSAPPSPRCPGGAAIDEFTAALRAGMPVLLWHPDVTPEKLTKLVMQLTASGGLIGLPEQSRISRSASLGSPVQDLARDLVVLWDDPDRIVVLGTGPS